jgi:hypothetical protein
MEGWNQDEPEGVNTFNRVLKNRAQGRNPALCDFCKCSHLTEYAALSKTPQALADDFMFVFQHPVRC